MAVNAGQRNHTYIIHQMYLFKATSLALLAASPVVFGSPLLEIRQNGVTCQTSSGSPLTDDVTNVINELNGRGGNCNQTNGEASGKSWISLNPAKDPSGNANFLSLDCTTLAKSGSAAISICGGKDDISCADVAGFADQIQQTCLNGDPGNPQTRTGGTYTINPSVRVEVIDTSSV